MICVRQGLRKYKYKDKHRDKHKDKYNDKYKDKYKAELRGASPATILLQPLRVPRLREAPF